ncbi:MAG TPA: hypothetical protein VHT02_05425, partial [Methylocella sp.]|nr:hypothetical protein [Methylocella sp.]
SRGTEPHAKPEAVAVREIETDDEEIVIAGGTRVERLAAIPFEFDGMVFPQGILDERRRRKGILDEHDAPAGAIVRRRAVTAMGCPPTATVKPSLAIAARIIAVISSAGLAESAGDSSAALLRRADRALYRSKQDGRNRASVGQARD